ncbi:DNA polymerase [Yersinia phage fHe-Yen9-02]|nr:DNA polymerase [Yersinia phage fHe-Yen9-02]
MKLSHLTLPYDPPANFEDVQCYDFVRVLKHNSKNPKAGKALLVIDHMPTEDLEAGKIFSGTTGEVFLNQVQYLEDVFPLKTTLDDWHFLVISYNMFKTYEKSDQYKEDANNAFADRMREVICDFKPDYVITFGNQPLRAINQAQVERVEQASGVISSWYGVTIPTKVKHKKKTHEFIHVPNISFNQVLNPRNISGTSYTLGYMSRWMLPWFQKGMPYKIPKITCGKKRNWTLKYLTKVSDVEKLIKKMKKAKHPCIDTETENLNRIKNKLQTIQVSMDGEIAYVVPIYHRDSPFSPKEVRKVTELFRDFFEYNSNKYQIFTNGKFDLNVIKSNCGVRSFRADIWDIQAGEFINDENAKSLQLVTGSGYYNLANLTMQYGCTVYLDLAFGKEMRKTISEVDLDENVQEYAAVDVIVPYHICMAQRRRAKDIKYEKYESMVSQQVSDQIHAFSIMEVSGAMADIDYLFKLNLPNSPINQEIQQVEKKFLSSPEVREANAKICKDDQIPAFGLMGRVDANKFDMSKSEHKQILFFDIMKLKPLKESDAAARSNGKKNGKLDKDFQEAYKDNPLVNLYTKLGKAYKLRNAYVKSLLKLWGESEDFKHDRCLRPQYNYLRIVTGRTSASDPNLQQIPSRSEMGKLIKRILISRKNRLLIKVDYSAHEVRGWSIISGDQGVADVFEQGARLRRRFRTVPDPWIHHLIDVEGDVHKINAAYFFGIPITEVTKPIRNAVKTVIFGLIYQQGDNGLAKSTGRDVKEIGKIKGQFLDRFPIGYKWFDKIKKFAHENFFVESPLGRRRHLWGFMIPKSHRESNMVHAACDRRAVNSPVQGFGSDLMMSAIRILDRMKFEYWEANGQYPDFELNVSVHDSLTVDCDYKWIFLALDMIERSMTSAVTQVMKERHNYEFTSVPEIDFEIGATERDVKGWDFSYKGLEKLIRKGLEIKRDDLNEKDLDVDAVTKDIMENQYHLMGDWMKKQLWANDIKIPKMGKVNPLTNKDNKDVKQWLKELPANTKTFEAYVAAEALKEAEKAKVSGPDAKAKKTIKISNKLLKKAMTRFLN